MDGNKDTTIIISYLIDIKQDLGRVQESVNSVEKQIDYLSESNQSLSKRLTKVEHDASKLRGALALLAILGTIGGLLKLVTTGLH